jgi:hypothetical protein
MCSRTNCSMRSSKISVFVFALMPPISHLAANSATQGVNSYVGAEGQEEEARLVEVDVVAIEHRDVEAALGQGPSELVGHHGTGGTCT